MKNSNSRKDYVEETLRLCNVLVNMKYGAEDDENIKRLIRDNLIEIAKIDARIAELRQQKRAESRMLKHSACFQEGR